MTCVMKDDGKFYPHIFLEEALFVKLACKENKHGILHDGRFVHARRWEK